MHNKQFHRLFKSTGPAVTPVIHVLDLLQVENNIAAALGENVAGVFLINHDFGIEAFLPIVRAARQRFPDIWIGLNFLAVTGGDAFPILGQLAQEDCPIDAYWADDARINEHMVDQTEAIKIDQIRQDSGWNGLYFGGTAFKKQRPVAPDQMEMAAHLAIRYMDVVTTSGVATGEEANHDKIDDFRRGVGSQTLALASGITPENAASYNQVDCFLVATGINKTGDFYNIDTRKLAQLMEVTQRMEPHGND